MVDILEILGTPVEVKENETLFAPQVEEIEVEFTDEIEEEIPVTEERQQIDDSEYSDEPIYLSPRDTAESIVGCIDGLQSFGLPMFLKKQAFTARELELLDSLDTTGATPYPLNSPEIKLLNRYNKYLAIVDQFPFSVDEKRRLVDGTARYVKVTNMKVTPLTGLMMAFGDVTAKRFMLFNSID